MGSRTISVDDEAYGLLKSAKLGEESFSDVIKRTLAPTRPKLSDLFGALDPKVGDAISRDIRARRRRDRASAAERYRDMWK